MQENTSISEKRKFQVEEAILILLLIFSLIGTAISDYSPDDGYGYWLGMVVVFAIFAIIIAWLQSKHKDGEFKEIVKEQCLHWLTTMLVVAGAFLLRNAGQLSAESASLVILLLLCLATILDGLRIGWRFSLVGLFLGSASIIRGYYEPFLAIDIIIAVIIVIASFLWEYWMNKRAKNGFN